MERVQAKEGQRLMSLQAGAAGGAAVWRRRQHLPLCSRISPSTGLSAVQWTGIHPKLMQAAAQTTTAAPLGSPMGRGRGSCLAPIPSDGCGKCRLGGGATPS